MCSQIYSHPVEGYKCFANANKSQGTYYTCCDLDTREIRYVTYIYDGYFMGYYLVQSPTKVTENYANCQGMNTLPHQVMGCRIASGIVCQWCTHHHFPYSKAICLMHLTKIFFLESWQNSLLPQLLIELGSIP